MRSARTTVFQASSVAVLLMVASLAMAATLPPGAGAPVPGTPLPGGTVPAALPPGAGAPVPSKSAAAAVPAKPAAAATTATSSAKSTAATTATATTSTSTDLVLYGDGMIPIDTLFKNYQAARAELQGEMDKVNAAKDRLKDIQQRIAAVQNDVASTERPMRAELSKDLGKQKDYTKWLNAKPPVKPTPKPLPPQPNQAAYPSASGYGSGYTGSSGYGSGYGSGSGSGSGMSQAYQQALTNWQNQVTRITADNTKALADYTKAQADYQKNKDEATKEGPTVDAAILDLQQKLDALATGVKTKQAPILEEQKKAVAAVQAVDQEAAGVKTRIDGMAAALRTAPDSMRIKYSLVEWETVFYTLPDLTKVYVTTQSEINSVTEQLKADGDKAGTPLPEGWRHPQQDRMDALKAILLKANGGIPIVIPATPPAASATPTSTGAPVTGF